MRLPTPAGDGAAHLAMLEHVTPHDEVLDDLAALLATIPPDLGLPLVVIHDTGPISIIVADPDLQPLAPWRHDPGVTGEPARWTARLGDRGPCRSIGLPLLLTLGRTGTSTVLANLGTIGTLTIDGNPDQVRNRLRAMTYEAATSRTAGPLEVVVHGDDLIVDLDQVRTIEDPSVEIAVAATEADIIDDDRLPRLIVTHHPGLDLTLPPEAARFCAIAQPGSPTAGGWTLTVDGEHGRLHLPNGTIEELTLPDLHPQLITAEFERLTDTVPPPPPDTTDGNAPITAPVMVDRISHPERSDEPCREVQEPWCEVGLLGPLLASRDHHPIEGLTTTSRQLLAYLATHPDGVTLERLDDAIWPSHAPSHRGQRARTALTRLRRCLGDGPDGQPLLPRRENRDHKIQLSPAVGTDFDRSFRHLATARTLDGDEQVAELIAALALVRGEPFEDLPYSWTLDIQQRAIAQLQDAALTAAPHLREAGRYTEAEQIIIRALALCDPAEPLYIEWARLELARGRPDRIPHLLRRLRQRYADDADDITATMTTPTTETERAFRTLLNSTED
jgi:DNA-binding SARP family transcriptional activator